jgi:hypothetical protein
MIVASKRHPRSFFERFFIKMNNLFDYYLTYIFHYYTYQLIMLNDIKYAGNSIKLERKKLRKIFPSIFFVLKDSP